MNSVLVPHLKLISDSSDDGHNITIQLANYRGGCAKIRCCLSGQADLHSYQLKTKDNSGYRVLEVSSTNNWCARFDHLEVHESPNRPKKRKYDETTEPQVDIGQMVFKFQAWESSSDTPIGEPLHVQFSPAEEPGTDNVDVVCSSRSSGLVTGSEDMMLFIQPAEGEVTVRFFQLDSNEVEVWSTLVHPSYVHHNCALKFQTPPYLDLHVEQPVEVYFEVVYSDQSRRSERHPFTYIPNRVDECHPLEDIQMDSGIRVDPFLKPIGPNIALTTRIFLNVNNQLPTCDSSQLIRAMSTQQNDFTIRLRSLMKMRWFNDNGILHLTLIRRQIRSFGVIMKVIRTAGFAQEFVNERNGCDQTPLQLAALQKLPEAMTLLIASGADPNVLDSNGNSVLHLVVSDVKWIGCLTALLTARGPIPVRMNQLNCRGQSALHVAVEACNEMATRCLLEHGADLRLKEGSQGQTCLHISVVRRSCELAELLLAQRNLDIKAVRFDGRTALDVAETLKYHDMAQLIRRRYRES